MKQLTLFIFSLSIILLGCKDSNTKKENISNTESSSLKKQQKPELTKYQYKLDSLNIKGGGPCKDGADCCNVNVQWHTLTGGDKEICKIINDSTLKHTMDLMGFVPGEMAYDLDSVALYLINDYKSAYDSKETFGLGWELDIDSEVKENNEIITVHQSQYAFFGGAHPNSYIKMTNFDKNTGKVIRYEDFVIDSTAFLNLILKELDNIMVERLGEGASHKDLGWDNPIKPAKNFAFEKDHLSVFYNSYEIAAYALGQFEVKLPYKQLEGIIKR